eukprot:TRINITY_DN85368_c0_g1_i1.p1 TRINITY_DN85368_c0_g1~~TRINITY_DN85368_c0_g1_i1.p1  ORF type:complete len:245 (-),score=35.63 TRINITY_DN85368_c0_g1_i1:93-827(-)
MSCGKSKKLGAGFCRARLAQSTAAACIIACLIATSPLAFTAHCFAAIELLRPKAAAALHRRLPVLVGRGLQGQHLGRSSIHFGLKCAETSKPATGSEPKAKGRWQRLRSWLTDAESRRRFASMGAAGVLSYGLVSNLNYIPLWAFAWYVVAARNGVSPVHQWPTFLSFYATLYVANNILRPLKLVALGVVTPRVDRLFSWTMRKFSLGKKRAVALVYVVLNTLVILLMGLSIAAASLCAGVPIW